jgi:hypothetical protein
VAAGAISVIGFVGASVSLRTRMERT